MAFNPAPSAMIPSISLVGDDVTFDITDLTKELTQAEANPTTGDLREIVFSFLDHAWNYLNQLPTEDKPAKLIISKSASLQANGEYQLSYNVSVRTVVSDEDIASE
jgi:hypothetical protein